MVVDANHHVHLQALDIGRDYGTSLEILNGLKPDDWIVLNPPDSIEADEEVHVKELKNPIEPAPAEGEPGSTPSLKAKPASEKKS